MPAWCTSTQRPSPTADADPPRRACDPVARSPSRAVHGVRPVLGTTATWGVRPQGALTLTDSRSVEAHPLTGRPTGNTPLPVALRPWPRSSWSAHADRTLEPAVVDDLSALRDLGASGCHQASSGHPRRPHQRGPVVSADGASRLRRAHRGTGRPPVQQGLQGGLELPVDIAESVFAAVVRAPAHRVPVASPGLAPGDGPAAASAGLGRQWRTGHASSLPREPRMGAAPATTRAPSARAAPVVGEGSTRC